MPWRFRRTLKILPGIRLNFNKRSISTSVGFRGFHITLGKQGVRRTVGIPGTGLSHTSTIGNPHSPTWIPKNPDDTQPLRALPPVPVSQSLPAPEPAVGGADADGLSARQLLLIGGALIAMLVAAGVCLVGVISVVSPPPPPVIDMVAIGTSAARTAWAPSTQTAAARFVPVQVAATDLPSPSPLPTFKPQTAVPLMGLSPVATEPLPTIPKLYRVPPTLGPSHPSGTTGLCNDGTYTYAQHSQGACSWHGGLKRWWGP